MFEIKHSKNCNRQKSHGNVKLKIKEYFVELLACECRVETKIHHRDYVKEILIE